MSAERPAAFIRKLWRWLRGNEPRTMPPSHMGIEEAMNAAYERQVEQARRKGKL